LNESASVAGRVVAALLLSASTVLVSASPANAAEVVLKDGRGDMWRINFDEKTGEGYLPAPNATNGDVLRVKIRHTDTHVVIREKFVDLRRAGDLLVIGGSIRTNEGVRRELAIWAEPGNWKGAVEFSGRRGQDAGCPVKHVIDYGANTALIKIPRLCLRDPRWVQLQLADGTMMGGYQNFRFLIDNPHNAQAEPKGWTSRIRRG
jgi:hypothetical protein